MTTTKKKVKAAKKGETLVTQNSKEKKTKTKKKREVLKAFSTQSTATLTPGDLEAKKLLLQPIRNRIGELAKGIMDVTVPLGAVKFHVNGFPTGVGIEIEKKVYGLTPWSMSQFGNRIGAPASFLWKLYQRGRHRLLLQNLLELQDENKDQEMLFRTIATGDSRQRGKSRKEHWTGALIRGVLTPSFTATDNGNILDVLQDELGKSWRVVNSLVDPEIMALQIADREQTMAERKVGNAMYGGLSIYNSEVGRKSVQMQLMLYRLRCTNGAVMPQTLYYWSRRHTGDSTEEFREELKRIMGEMPTLLERVNEATKAAQAKVLSDARVEQMLDIALDNPEGGKPLIAAHGNDRAETVKQLFDVVRREAKLTVNRKTRWGVINALTQKAQNLPVDARHKVENYAGALLLATK